MIEKVYIVDDDSAIRESLQQLLEIVGYCVETYANGEAFLSDCTKDYAGCIILDMAMPHLTGHNVQAKLRERHIDLPIIFISGHGAVPDAVRAVKNGAYDFLEKPVKADVLLENVRQAMAIDKIRRNSQSHCTVIKSNYNTLSPREKEVMWMVIEGLANKEIARKLDLSPRTVEVHRSHVMYKMGASNLPQLIKFSEHCST